MPRSLWNGTITFGAVAVPVKLHSAVQAKTVHFHEIRLADGSRTSIGRSARRRQGGLQGGSRSRIIDPVFFDKAYFLGARDEGADAYRLLHDALAKTGKAALR